MRRPLLAVGGDRVPPSPHRDRAATDRDGKADVARARARRLRTHRDHHTTRTVLRDQTWNRFWNRLSPRALQRRRSAPSK